MTRGRANEGDGGDEPFVSRWSRRKHAAREREQQAAHDDRPETAAEQPREGSAGPEAGEPVPGDGRDDADLPTDADMPPLESLDADSDYSGFMSPRVSESLRRMALRKLFGAPAFNVRDGLDDYDVDYTHFDPLGATVTADMRHHAERRRTRDAEREAEAGRDAAGPSGDEEIDVASGDTDAGGDAPGGGETADPPPEERPGDDDEDPDDGR